MLRHVLDLIRFYMRFLQHYQIKPAVSIRPSENPYPFISVGVGAAKPVHILSHAAESVVETM